MLDVSHMLTSSSSNRVVDSALKAYIICFVCEFIDYNMGYCRFHVDKMSSAHVYVRLHKGQTIDDISEGLLEDCVQLVKANSIQGISRWILLQIKELNVISFILVAPFLIRIRGNNCINRYKFYLGSIFMWCLLFIYNSKNK